MIAGMSLYPTKTRRYIDKHSLIKHQYFTTVVNVNQ